MDGDFPSCFENVNSQRFSLQGGWYTKRGRSLNTAAFEIPLTILHLREYECQADLILTAVAREVCYAVRTVILLTLHGGERNLIPFPNSPFSVD